MNYGVSVSSCLMTPLIWVLVLFVIYYMPIVCLVHPLEEVLKKFCIYHWISVFVSQILALDSCSEGT